jgi:hypothetical protein
VGERAPREMFSPSSPAPQQGGRGLELEDERSGPSSSSQSVCGIWIPFFSSNSGEAATTSTEEAESIIDSILTASVLPNYQEKVLPQLEILLDKHGIESVVYLPSKGGGQMASGKKCMIRSYMGQARVEFRVRSAGELKKMKFDWGDIEEMGAGKYADSASPTLTPGGGSAPTAKKGQANCYFYIKIRDRGTVDLRFESKALRDATLMGFKLLAVKRSTALA